MKLLLLLIGALTALAVPQSTFANCKSLLATQVAWSKNAPRGYMRGFKWTMATSKIRSQGKVHGSFSQGYARFDKSQSVYESTAKQFFSDRKVGRSSQGFDVNRADSIELTLTANGTASIKLNSWGGGVLRLQNMTCSSDRLGLYITGFTREVNGTSVRAIALKQSEDEILF